MADTTTKILSIRLDADKAINGILDLNNAMEANNRQIKLNNDEIKKNNAAMKESGADVAALTDKNKVLAQTNEELGAQQKVLASEKRSLQKEIQNEIKMRTAEEGSLKALRAELSNLTKQWDAMGRSQRQGAAGDALRDDINRVTTELKAAEEETQRYFRNVGNYPGAVKPLRTELRELTMQLAEMERNGQRGSEAYNQLAAQAGKLKDAMSDARREINRQSSDIKTFEGVVDIVKTATTAWQVYQGAMNAFGIESEEAMKAMQKLQGIMAITNGLKQLGTQLTNNETATYKAYHAVLRMLGLEKTKDVVNTNAETAAQTANATAMTASAGAAKILRTALAALGIGALITAIAALVAYWDDVKAFFGGMTAEEERAAKITKELNDIELESAKTYAKVIAELAIYEDRIKNFNGTKAQEKQLVDELNQKYGTTLGTYKSLAQWQDVITTKGKSYAKMLMLQAQAQAVLNKYSETYIAVLTAQQKVQAIIMEMGKLDWLDDLTNKGGKLQMALNAAKAELKAAEADATAFFRQYLNLSRQIDSISAGNGFNPPTTTTPTTAKTPKKTSSKSDADKEAKARLDALRKAEDAEIALIKDLHEKERKETELKFKRQIEDIKGNSEEEIRLRVALKKQMEDALAQLEQKYSDEAVKAEQERIQKMLAIVEKNTQEELNLRLDSLRNELDLEMRAIDASDAAEEEKDKQRNLALQTYLHNRNELIGNYDKMLAERRAQAVENDFNQRINDAFGNELEILRIQYEQKQQLLEQAQQREDETIEAFNARRIQLESDYLNAKKSLDDKEREMEQAKYDFASSIASGLAGVFQTLGEDNTAFAKLSKVLALAEIAINTGKAVAAGIASAMSVPFPANLAAIATTIGAVLSGMASAIKTVNSAKFATGGYIEGAGTSTSDSIPIRVSNGESVMNANTTAMFGGLLSSLNQLGGGVPIQASQTSASVRGEDMLARAVARGVAMLPNPVVSVEDINRGQRQVAVVQERAML